MDTSRVSDLSVFKAKVGPEFVAKTSAPIDPNEPLVNFSKICQWPPKDWYQERMAEVMNRLCGAGKVSSVSEYGGLLLAHGKCLQDLVEVDLGPDQICVIFCFFRSPHTPEELNQFLDMDFPRPITKEGEVGSANWMYMTGPHKTIVQQMVEEMDAKEEA
jgi:hypothetical protein